MIENHTKTEAFLFVFRSLYQASDALPIIKLRELIPEQCYVIDGEKLIYGDELMNIGLYVDFLDMGDFQAKMLHLTIPDGVSQSL